MRLSFSWMSTGGRKSYRLYGASPKKCLLNGGTASFNVDSHPACNRQTPSYYVPCVSVHVSRKVGKTFASNKKIYFLLSCKTHSFSFFLQQLEPIMPPRLAPDFSPTKVRTSCTSFGCVCERCKKISRGFFSPIGWPGHCKKSFPALGKLPPRRVTQDGEFLNLGQETSSSLNDWFGGYNKLIHLVTFY